MPHNTNKEKKREEPLLSPSWVVLNGKEITLSRRKEGGEGGERTAGWGCVRKEGERGGNYKMTQALLFVPEFLLSFFFTSTIASTHLAKTS